MEAAGNYQCLSTEITLEKSIQKYSTDIAEILYSQSNKLKNVSRYSPSDTCALDKQSVKKKVHRSSKSPDNRNNSQYNRYSRHSSPIDYYARYRHVRYRRRSNSRDTRDQDQHLSHSSKRRRSHSRGYSPQRNNEENNSAVSKAAIDVRTSLLKTSKKVVPEYDPLCRDDTVFDWIAKVEVCKEIFGWDEPEMVEVAVSKLTGTAKDWYSNLITVPNSWNELRVKLIEAFPNQDNYADLLTSMLARKIHFCETLECYYHQKIALLHLCGIKGRNAVDCIIHGIKNDILRAKIQAAQLRDTDQLLVYFQAVDTTNEICASSNETNNIGNVYKNVNKNAPANRNATVNEKINKMPTCFHCSKYGHTLTNCPVIKRKCYVCGGFGHIAKQCRHNPNKVIKKKWTGIKTTEPQSQTSSDPGSQLPASCIDLAPGTQTSCQSTL